MAIDPKRDPVETDADDDDGDLLSKFVYEDKSIDELASERGEVWPDTYHALLEKLDETGDY